MWLEKNSVREHFYRGLNNRSYFTECPRFVKKRHSRVSLPTKNAVINAGARDPPRVAMPVALPVAFSSCFSLALSLVSPFLSSPRNGRRDRRGPARHTIAFQVPEYPY